MGVVCRVFQLVVGFLEGGGGVLRMGRRTPAQRVVERVAWVA